MVQLWESSHNLLISPKVGLCEDYLDAASSLQIVSSYPSTDPMFPLTLHSLLPYPQPPLLALLKTPLQRTYCTLSVLALNAHTY